MSFEKYYETIELPQEFRNRVNDFANIARSISQKEIERVFISTSSVDGGNIDIGDLCFFAEGTLISFANSWRNSNYPNIFLMSLNTHEVEITYSNFNFSKSGDESSLNVLIKLGDKPLGEEPSYTLQAYAENCSVLQELITQYLIPK